MNLEEIDRSILDQVGQGRINFAFYVLSDTRSWIHCAGGRTRRCRENYLDRANWKN